MLLNDTVNCQCYVRLVINEWMSVEQWRNATGRGNLKWAKRSLSQCHFIDHKFHMDRTGTKLLFPWWETGDWLPEPRAAPVRFYRLCLWSCSFETLLRPVISLTVLIFCVLEHRSLSQILYTSGMQPYVSHPISYLLVSLNEDLWSTFRTPNCATVSAYRITSIRATLCTTWCSVKKLCVLCSCDCSEYTAIVFRRTLSSGCL